MFDRLESLYILTTQINLIKPSFKPFTFILPTDTNYYKAAYLNKNIINKQSYSELIDFKQVTNFLGLI